ncbi:hypothetical protein [Rhodalgimonas zhirmunskyi]|uniref:Tryptophan-rich sensory protein n=1 Tax=Rhodalgimonas zhirmunskyi TaxID=2964767 RepID=A0AAJ1U8L8_9RHOB|nr:hypothetical protein [Rhodoalgimonas zhirmunskyi]MDQ2093303.1 hypothetical protein [Rhodoalgimonas zhirmunskyi]
MKQFAWLIFFTAIAFAASPFFSDGFNGFTAGQFPVPQDNPPVQPAGWAFAIWGVIYLWLIIGTGFGAIARPYARDWDLARPSLLVTLGIGVFWIPVANLSVPWATVMIWAMLIFAVLAMLLSPREDRWLMAEPVGLYAGWLTAASCVSIGLMLAGYGIVSEQAAALIGLGIALVIALAVQYRRPGVLAYPVAVIWALAGVVAKNLTPVNLPVLGLAVLGMILLALAAWRPARSEKTGATSDT